MSAPTHDDKAFDGSVNEKDAQVGASEEIYIDPVAEKKVEISWIARTRHSLTSPADPQARPCALAHDGFNLPRGLFGQV